MTGLCSECSMVLEFDLYRVHEQLKAACSRTSGDSPLHVFVAGLYADSAVALKILTVSAAKLLLSGAKSHLNCIAVHVRHGHRLIALTERLRRKL